MKSQKIKKLSYRKFLAPLWNSMCQSVLLKHILLCVPACCVPLAKKIDQLNLIDEGYVLYQVFVIPKKGTYFVFSKISKKLLCLSSSSTLCTFNKWKVCKVFDSKANVGICMCFEILSYQKFKNSFSILVRSIPGIS